MSEAKRLAGEKAIDYVEDGMIVGVGTGSTVAYFIDALGRIKDRIQGAVSSSEQSSQRLRALGIEVFDLNAVGPLALYVDGADECDPHKRLIKGGGAALTREKIIAEASQNFVCIVDAGQARRPARQVSAAGRGDPDGAQPGRPRDRRPDPRTAGVARTARCVTDNGNGSSTSTASRSPIRWGWKRRSTRSPEWSASACSRAARPMSSSSAGSRHRCSRAVPSRARRPPRAAFCVLPGVPRTRPGPRASINGTRSTVRRGRRPLSCQRQGRQLSAAVAAVSAPAAARS